MTADQKKGPKPDRFPWGRILDVHVIGRYAMIEYQSARPGNAQRGWKSERMFSGYLHQPESKRADSRGWMDIGQSFHSMDAALVGLVAYAAEGGNSQAARFFMKMIAPDAEPQAPQEDTFVNSISAEEVDKALAELTEMGVGTTLDRPAAILHRLRGAQKSRGEK